MNLISSIMRALSVAVMVVVMVVTIRMADATATPDNFFLSFDKDLHIFGVKHRDTKSNQVKDDDIKKTTEVHIIDDFDKAEEEIFHRVENAERLVLGAVGDLMRDEVNSIFGNIKHSEDQKITRKGRGTIYNGKAITNVDKPFEKRDHDHIKQIDARDGFLEMMDAYADHCYDYGGF